MTFMLQIELGNDAMREPEHVAHALGEVAALLRRDAPTFNDGAVRDSNGNTVGAFYIAEAV